MAMAILHRGRLAILIQFGIAGCAPVTAPIPLTAKSPDSAAALSTQDSAPEEKLEQRIAFAQFQSIALSSAIDQWSAAAGVKAVIDWQSLQAAGVNATTPVTVTLKNVRLGKALQQILESLPNESYRKKLAYCVDRGQVFITTNQQLDSRRVSRNYDISDLMPPTISAPMSDPLSDPMDQIKRYLTGNVDALSWDENVDVMSWQDAGASGQKHMLVIVQLPEVQWKIQQSLASLRAEMAQKR